jgi:hypothetical protein
VGNPRPLSNRDLVTLLELFGVRVLPSRGKGSETILIRETIPGSGKGPTYPIKWHKGSDQQNKQVIKKILDRFQIDPDKFW